MVGLVAGAAEREPVRAVRSVPRSASVTVSVEDHASALGRAKPMARRAPRAFLLEEVSEKAFFLSLLRGAPIARVGHAAERVGVLREGRERNNEVARVHDWSRILSQASR